MSEEDRLKTNNEKVTINDYYYYYLLKCENILNELEKWVEEKFKIENTQYYYVIDANDLKRKLQELKGVDKE